MTTSTSSQQAAPTPNAATAPAGTGDSAAPAASTPNATPDEGDKPLGPGGERALKAERDRADAEAKARKDLEQRLEKLAPLEKIAEVLGTQGGQADPVQVLQERLNKHEQDLAGEREARWRAEVAHEKNLRPEQAARLVGKTREQLAADADALIAAFGVAAVGGAPAGPRPDLSQGGKGQPPALNSSKLEQAIKQKLGIN